MTNEQCKQLFLDQVEADPMPPNFGVVLYDGRQGDAGPVYLYRYVTLKETRDHLMSRGHLKRIA